MDNQIIEFVKPTDLLYGVPLVCVSTLVSVTWSYQAGTTLDHRGGKKVEGKVSNYIYTKAWKVITSRRITQTNHIFSVME